MTMKEVTITGRVVRQCVRTTPRSRFNIEELRNKISSLMYNGVKNVTEGCIFTCGFLGALSIFGIIMSRILDFFCVL